MSVIGIITARVRVSDNWITLLEKSLTAAIKYTRGRFLSSERKIYKIRRNLWQGER